MSEEAITGDTVLNVKHVGLVLDELELALFSKDKWQTFGLKAGLFHNNLQVIKGKNPGDVEACCCECVASWLRREDNVDDKGMPTLLRLADIVEKTGDKAAADEIRKKIKEKDEAIQKSNMVYTGRMYYIKREDGHWKTCYTVTRDFEVLKYLEHVHPDAEYDETVDTFCFIQPNGTLHLHMNPPPEQRGWSVNPDRDPMIIRQSRVDQFPSNPLSSTCSMSVFAEPGVADESLHFPVKLTGIDPETTIYINRPPPSSNIDNKQLLNHKARRTLPKSKRNQNPSLRKSYYHTPEQQRDTCTNLSSNTENTSSTSSITGDSQTSRETDEESTFRPDVASRRMNEKKNNDDLYLDKLVEMETKKNEQSCVLTVDQIRNGLVKAFVEKDFELFVELIKHWKY